ncbi:unnamed protein product [Victoria cruziana]
MEAVKVQENEKEEEKRRPTFPARKSNSPFSSPTHDFEFSITLAVDSNRKPTPPTQPSQEIDLCPADDLFFQGHLLPLQHHHHHHDGNHPGNETADEQKRRSSMEETTQGSGNDKTSTSKGKPRSFSFVALKKGSKLGLKSAKEVIEKYMKLVKPLFTWGSDNRKNEEQKSASSGRRRWNCRNHSARSSTIRRPSRSSGPCSSAVRSPVNSGVLCPVSPLQKSDSTMEDLQNAIQAAIAHCKNSNAAPEGVHQP